MIFAVMWQIHIRERSEQTINKGRSPYLSTSCFTDSIILTHFATKWVKIHYLGSLTRYEKYYKTTFVKHKKLDNIQSGASSQAKIGGAYFSGVTGSIQDPIAVPGLYEVTEF